jgi:small-conductance mechanosensitive channel
MAAGAAATRAMRQEMTDVELLDARIYGNPLTDWSIAFGIAALIVLAVALVKPIVLRRLAATAERTQTPLDDALAAALDATQLALVALLALYLGSQNLELPARAGKVFGGAATLALFAQVGLWGAALLDFWIRRSRARALATDAGAATSLAAIGFIGRLVLWTLVALLALDNLGVNVTTLIAGLGIGGIAVALAVQNILGDLFASLAIVTDKPFVIGDFIIVDDFKGTVEHVGLKTTLIRSLDGEQIVFSNSDLLKMRIRNFKRMYERRIAFRFGVTYDATPEQLEQIPGIVRRLVESHKKVRFERSHFWRFGDSSLDFETIFWVTDPDYTLYLDIQQAVNLALMRELERLGVAFAFPTRTVQIDGPVEVATGAVPGPA